MAADSLMIGVAAGFVSLTHCAPPCRALASLIVRGAATWPRLRQRAPLMSAALTSPRFADVFGDLGNREVMFKRGDDVLPRGQPRGVLLHAPSFRVKPSGG